MREKIELNNIDKNSPNDVLSTHIVNLRNHGIQLKQGKKSKEDKIVLVGDKAINMIILGKIFLETCKIQNKLSPKGDEQLVQYLEEIRKAGMLTENIRTNHNIQSDETTLELNGKMITREVLGLIYSEMCKIQDNLYPHGKGSKYLAEYIEELKKSKTITNEIREKFRI